MNRIIVNVLFIGACISSCMSIQATLKQEVAQIIEEMRKADTESDCCSVYLRGLAHMETAKGKETIVAIKNAAELLVAEFKSRMAHVGGREEVVPGSRFDEIQRESDPAKIGDIIRSPKLSPESISEPSFVWRNRYPIFVVAFIAISYGIYEYCRHDDEPSFDDQYAKTMKSKRKKKNNDC